MNSTDRYVLLNVLLISFATVIHILIEFMKSNKSYDGEYYDNTKSFLNYLMIGMGLYFITDTAILLINNADHYLNLTVLTKFILPFIYSALFIPFVYAIGSYIIIESQLTRNSFIISNNEKLLKFLNKQTVINFTFSPEKINQFNRELWQHGNIDRDKITSIIKGVLNNKN